MSGDKRKTCPICRSGVQEFSPEWYWRYIAKGMIKPGIVDTPTKWECSGCGATFHSEEHIDEMRVQFFIDHKGYGSEACKSCPHYTDCIDNDCPYVTYDERDGSDASGCLRENCCHFPCSCFVADAHNVAMDKCNARKGANVLFSQTNLLIGIMRELRTLNRNFSASAYGSPAKNNHTNQAETANKSQPKSEL